ncbi:MAG: HAD family hydrolase [Candidatus Bipolaricaulota bacterium]|nr:HAD family hydrolase [Candidatus Bipolaricaulota bacterium]
MIRAVLLDLGGPVFDEDAEYRSWTDFLLGALAAEGVVVSPEALAREVAEATARCDPHPYVSAVWTFVRPDLARFRRIRDGFREHTQGYWRDPRGAVLRPEAREVIPQLAERYALGIAANQPVAALRLLAEAGLLPLFRWPHVSEAMGVVKPSPLFFRMILDGLGVRPEEAVMVGDRLDYDVLPARLLGLRTVRVLVGPYARQEPISPLHVPDRTISTLTELPDALASLEGG